MVEVVVVAVVVAEVMEVVVLGVVEAVVMALDCDPYFSVSLKVLGSVPTLPPRVRWLTLSCCLIARTTIVPLAASDKSVWRNYLK